MLATQNQQQDLNSKHDFYFHDWPANFNFTPILHPDSTKIDRTNRPNPQIVFLATTVQEKILTSFNSNRLPRGGRKPTLDEVPASEEAKTSKK